jgi:type I restriction enzyme S subunit
MIPPNWATVTVGELIDEEKLLLQNGFSNGEYNQSGRGVVHLRPFNVSEDGTLNLRRTKYVPAPSPNSPYWVEKGDVIFNNTNSEELVGKTGYCDEEGAFVLSNHMTILRVLDLSQIEGAWLARHLHFLWESGEFRKLCRRHVNQASVGVERLRSVELPLPPLMEQMAIARALEAVRQAKDTRQRELALERDSRVALMDHLFTNGIRGETTKQSEIGEIPESWQVKPLGAIADLVSGGTPSRENADLWKGTVPWASPKDMKRVRLVDTEEHVSRKAIEAGSRLVPSQTIFIVIRGMILAKDIPIALTEVPMAFNQDMKAALTRGGHCPEFLLYALIWRKDGLAKHIGTSAHGTRRLSTSAVASLQLPIPLLDEQVEIASVLGSCEAKINALERELPLHEELFRALLDELMTGHLSTLPLIEEQQAR